MQTFSETDADATLVECSHLNTHRTVKIVKCHRSQFSNKLCGRPPQYAPAPCKLTFDLLTNFSLHRPLPVIDLGPMYATDRRRTDRQMSDAHHRLIHLPYGRGHNNKYWGNDWKISCLITKSLLNWKITVLHFAS